MRQLFFFAVLYAVWKIFHDSDVRKASPRQASGNVANPWDQPEDPCGDYTKVSMMTVCGE